MTAEPGLKVFYQNEVMGRISKQFDIKNCHEVPRLEKIVINSAINADADKALIQEIQKEISLIAGQKAVPTKAKKSISNFKLRKGMTVGMKATLRANKMFDFLLKLVAVALPKIRDFRGISNKMDGDGNYTLGISDHTIFPEISIDKERKLVGMDITFVTSAENDEQGRFLLACLGLPFRKKA